METVTLNHQVLRTDISGMPLEWVGYQDAVRLYHLGQVAYTCGTLLYRIHGGINAKTVATMHWSSSVSATSRRSITRHCSGAIRTCACTAARRSAPAICHAIMSRR
jgi:hypothetical protein